MNQAVSFGLLFGGGLLLTKAITGSAWSDVVKGKPGSVSTTSLLPAVTSSGVAGAGSAIATTTATTVAGAPAKVDAMLALATSLEGAPYSKANHAGAFTQSVATVKQLGTDCSGFVSVLLGPLGAGVLTAPQTTQTLPGQPGISDGPGQYVTIYDRDTGAVDDEHVIIDIAGHWFESGGNSSVNLSGNDGITSIAAPPASYLSEFNQLLHPTGL
jgi:hypothetical protein